MIAGDLNVPGAQGVMFELVREMNAAIDQGEVGEPDAAIIRDAFAEFDRVLGVLALRRAEDEQPPVPRRGDRAADRGAPRGADASATSRGPTRSAGTWKRGDNPRGQRHGHALEEEVDRMRTDAPRHQDPLPGPKAAAIIARDSARVSPSYTRDYPFVMARGEGAVVEDVDGNVFLDCAAGIAVTGTGHSHPDVVQRHHRAGAEVPAHVGHGLLLRAAGASWPKRWPPSCRWPAAPATCGRSSATRAPRPNEAALKLARYSTKRVNIIAFLGSFHGRTLGCAGR